MDRHYESCPSCSKPKRKGAELCRKCKPSYERTAFHREFSRKLHLGKKKNYPTGGSLPGVAEKIRTSWTSEKRKLARGRGERMALSLEWRLRCGLPREKNPMWEDGRSVIPYARGWTWKAKEKAWKRAHGKCESCGGIPRDTHHKDFHKDNHSLENLIVLCRACHKNLHAAHLKQKKLAAVN